MALNDKNSVFFIVPIPKNRGLTPANLKEPVEKKTINLASNPLEGQKNPLNFFFGGKD